MRGEYKVPGGKLVAAEVEVEAGVISRVAISGDFFLEPDDVLEQIDSALVGRPESSTVAEMASVVQSVTADAHMVGFTPESVAIAVRRALGRAISWHDLTFEIIHEEPSSPLLNVALDQVLLEEVGAGRRGPALRFWEWDSAAVIIGSFQSLRNEVDSEVAERRGVRVIRRISGGGAMFMEPGNTITYSLYVPASLVDGLTFEQSYSFLDDWVLGALEEVGIKARYVPLNDIASEQGKIGGAAQKRIATGAVLHHATMAYNIDADAMGEVLRVGKEKLSDKGTASVQKRVDPMRRQTGMERAAIIESMKKYFASRYDTVPGSVTEEEKTRAQHLVETKFATPEWVGRVS